jgi:hypothetical protein
MGLAARHDNFFRSRGTQFPYHERSQKPVPTGNHNSPILPKAHSPSIMEMFSM